MRAVSHFLTLGAVLCALSAHAGQDVEAFAPEFSGDLRLEHFALEVLDKAPPTARALVASHGRPVGLVAWRRRSAADGIQLECESTFVDSERRAAPPRVLHVERLTEAGPRLVWREIGGSGRALRAEWSRDGARLLAVEWSLNETRRESVGTGAGAVMPLYLLELARTGRVTAGSFLRFDPLVRGLESIELCTSYEVDENAGRARPDDVSSDAAVRATAHVALRAVELRRGDGSSAGRYIFRGSDLIAFQWQDGDVWAVSISAEEYARRLAQIDPARVPRDL